VILNIGGIGVMAIGTMLWVVLGKQILIGDNPVTLIPDTATNNVSIGFTSTPGL
jgi:hypothetical protein